MLETSVAALKRLTTGKNGLSREAFEALCSDIRSSSVRELADRVFAPPPKKSAAPKPEWLRRMDMAKKRFKSWSAADFITALYKVAVDEGWVTQKVADDRPASLTFPRAAAKLAETAGKENVSRAFVAYINQRADTDKRT